MTGPAGRRLVVGALNQVVAPAPPAESAERFRALGLEVVQLSAAFARSVAGEGQPLAWTVEAWARAYRAAGVGLICLGAYANLLHPDPEVRTANERRLLEALDAAGACGIPYVATETGTCSAESPWLPHPANREPAAWAALVRITHGAVRRAEAAGVTLLYEPYVANVVSGPALGARLVAAVGSPRLRLLADPANWCRQEDLDDTAAVIRAGFADAGALFALAHAKDVRPAAEGGPVPDLPGAGRGSLDYPVYLALLAAHGYSGPLLLEHLGAEDVPAALAHVRAAAVDSGAWRLT